MLQYVNSFACTVNENQKNFVIHFRQNEPVIPENDDEDITFVANDIASVIMDEECAVRLAESIMKFFAAEKKDA